MLVAGGRDAAADEGAGATLFDVVDALSSGAKRSSLVETDPFGGMVGPVIGASPSNTPPVGALSTGLPTRRAGETRMAIRPAGARPFA
ncbi:MAG: hypothetical protein CMN22_05185 [Rubrivirga sp.]|nr:hypothetical protein [Rubrivirga sp.]